MAAYRKVLDGVTIEIYDVDHGPPHCHVVGLPRGATARVNLVTLKVSPAGITLPRTITRVLKAEQATMLAAWENVITIDRSE